jgi:hypothetical protein
VAAKRSLRSLPPGTPVRGVTRASSIFQVKSASSQRVALASSYQIRSAAQPAAAPPALKSWPATTYNRLLHPDQIRAIRIMANRGQGTVDQLEAVLCVLQNCDINGMSGTTGDPNMLAAYNAGIQMRTDNPELFRQLTQDIQAAGLLSGQFDYQPGGFDFGVDAIGLRLQGSVYTPFNRFVDNLTTAPENWWGWLAGAAKGAGNMNPDLQVPAPILNDDQARGAAWGQVITAVGATVFGGRGTGAETGGAAEANAANKIPGTFATAEEFSRFGADIQSGLTRAGYTDVQPILQGSAVTGRSYSTGAAFDVGRVSDFDVALASSSLLQRAQELGIELRSGGIRTGPLTAENLAQLGLSDMAQQMTIQYGREVNFMIYNSADAAAARAPSISIPKR